jgi:hypothetical protein
MSGEGGPELEMEQSLLVVAGIHIQQVTVHTMEQTAGAQLGIDREQLGGGNMNRTFRFGG